MPNPVLSLPRHGGQPDDLTLPQRRVMVAAILAAHVGGLWALLQVDAVCEAVLQVAPVFVELITPPAPPPPRNDMLPIKAPLPVIAVAPTPAPSPFEAPAPALAAEPPASQPAPLATVAPPSPAPPAPAAPAPRVIPASAVQYAEAPQVEYPRLGRKNGEAGLVVVRAWVDTSGGAPRNLQVHKSSGHARLDEAALAAVARARFKPYTENGRAVEGWALIPIDFELEK